MKGGGDTGNFVKKTCQKCRFWALFGKILEVGLFKITLFWPSLDERVAFYPKIVFRNQFKRFSRSVELSFHAVSFE